MWILIYSFSDDPSIVTDIDGKTIWFEKKEDADWYGAENLQEGFWTPVYLHK